MFFHQNALPTSPEILSLFLSLSSLTQRMKDSEGSLNLQAVATSPALVLGPFLLRFFRVWPSSSLTVCVEAQALCPQVLQVLRGGRRFPLRLKYCREECFFSLSS